MTTKFAIYFGLILTAAIVADYVLFDSAVVVFLGRKLLDLVDYFAFWR